MENLLFVVSVLTELFLRFAPIVFVAATLAWLWGRRES